MQILKSKRKLQEDKIQLSSSSSSPLLFFHLPLGSLLSPSIFFLFPVVSLRVVCVWVWKWVFSNVGESERNKRGLRGLFSENVCELHLISSFYCFGPSTIPIDTSNQTNTHSFINNMILLNILFTPPINYKRNNMWQPKAQH